jgi:ketosteroid isomerase-like protein
MTRARRFTPAALLLLTLTACAPAEDAELADAPAAGAEQAAPAPQTGPEVPAELQARGEAFTAAWNQDDPAVIAEFFTENAAVTADTATFNGRQEVLEGWLEPGIAAESTLAVQDQQWEAIGQDFRATGRFTYSYTSPEGDGSVTGTYETTWTRDADGQWRVSRMTSTADPAS